ncbi:hypothetical protein CspeluHIS016_0209680 [Cutaneotrichosporon spelunceum]|uniref:DNA primase n=1 Tax=Cutaneotrichosporon spelunceum TaxID=1672016 RepID=A0AAD3YBH1_9TREE|nr:hypothetical protein CspeluHIS016_0209680 [Cutaneotrichosporon spelunceum]
MVSTIQEDAPSSRHVMTMFYKRLFPYKPFFRWLNQSDAPGKLWTHREFAFTIENDVYIRYNSYSTAYDFQKDILRLVPSRFEIGPQYSHRPRDRKTLPTGVLQPQRRELVFDIDMTDYDEIRTCCTDKKICKRCWGFIAAAVKVLDKALRDTFGFKHLLWVYSGRRGIHCWVSDTLAVDLTDDQRRALVTFLEVIKGSKEQAKKVSVRGGRDDTPLHPYLAEAVETLKEEFVKLCLGDQDVFKSERGWEALLALPRQTNVDADREAKTPMGRKWDAALEDIILQYTYPRIDAEVSKHRNHLLKAPFCVHPGTGRVCVPIDPAKVDDFDPDTVPTVGELLVELDRASSSDNDGKMVEDYDRTSLKPYVEMLERHARAIMDDVRGARGPKEETMEF